MAKVIKKLEYGKRNIALIAFVATIAILLVFLLMVGRGESPAQNNIRNVVKLSENIRNAYKMKPDYWGLNTQSVLNQNITIIENSYKKPILVGQGFEAETTMPGSRSFDIIYKNLNRHQCISMLLANIKVQEGLGLISISVKNDKHEIEFSWSGDNALPINKKTARKYCIKNNDVMWEFE